MSRALRLHQTHTRAELVDAIEALRSDPDARQEGSLHILTPKAQRRLDDLLWALYWHDAPQGNTRMARPKHTGKWW